MSAIVGPTAPLFEFMYDDPQSIADAAEREEYEAEDDWRYDDDYDDFDDEGTDEFEESLMNCGQLPDGTCTKAGSEECDWECPFS